MHNTGNVVEDLRTSAQRMLADLRTRELQQARRTAVDQASQRLQERLTAQLLACSLQIRDMKRRLSNYSAQLEARDRVISHMTQEMASMLSRNERLHKKLHLLEARARRPRSSCPDCTVF